MGVFNVSSDESLDNLITAAQAELADDTAAMAEILRRFEGAALNVAWSITTDWHRQQDAAQGARLGLVRAVRAHTPGTPGFPSYARRFMKGHALRLLMAMSDDDIATDPQEPGGNDMPPRDTPTDTTFEVIDLISVMTEEQQTITVAHYVADRRLSDIARDLGVSTPAFSQRLSTIHRTLRPVVEEALAA